MADKVVKHTDIIEEKVFQPAADSADILLGKINLLIAGMKQLAVVTGKKIPLADPKTLSEAEQLAEAMRKIKDLENGLTAAQKVRIQAQVITNEQTKKYREELKSQTGAVENSTQALRKMQRELANLPAGSKEFNKLAKEAGLLKDKIGDAQAAVKAFSSESKLTNAKTLFGQIGTDLKDMNFTDAADKARQFAGVIKSMTFAEVLGGLKNFGSAMLDMGKALLMNPFAIMVGGAIALGFALDKLADKFGWFGRLSEQQVKNNEALVASNAVLAESYEKLGNIFSDEIRKRKAMGEDTGKLEDDLIERQLMSVRAQIKNMNLLTGLTTEQFKERADLLDKEASLESNLESQRLERTNKQKAALKETRDFVKKGREELKAIAAKNKEDEDKLAKEKRDKDKKLADELWKEAQAEADRLTAIEITRSEKSKAIADNLWKEAMAEADRLMGIDITRAEKKKKLSADLNAQLLKDQDDFLKETLAKWEKEAKEEKDRFLRRVEEAKKMNADIFDGLEETNKKEMKANSDKTAEIDRQINFQQQLALNGEKNSLDELEKERAKALEERAAIEKRAAQQREAEQMAEIFLEFYKAYAPEKEGAFGKALAATAKGAGGKLLAKALAGAFAEGVEDFKGKGTGTSDSNIIAFSKGESVLTAKGTKETSGLASAVNERGYLGAQEWAMQNVFPKVAPISDERRDVQLMKSMLSVIHSDNKELIETIKNKTEWTISENLFGEIVKARKQNGINRVTTVKNTPIINGR